MWCVCHSVFCMVYVLLLHIFCGINAMHFLWCICCEVFCMVYCPYVFSVVYFPYIFSVACCHCVFLRYIVIVYFLLNITEDKRLPSVQPIRVTLPENYPEHSPTCTTLPDHTDQSGKIHSCAMVVQFSH